MHVHIHCADGEAKFWLEPHVELARNHGLSKRQLTRIRKIIEEHERGFIRAWKEHFRY